MRKRFTQKDLSGGEKGGYVFEEKYHKRIPADGISQYMGTIWVRPFSPSSAVVLMRREQEAVVSNKDLDLPTQQELLAQFRCDEIANTVFASFVEGLGAIGESPGVGKIIVGLGGKMEGIRESALGLFSPFSAWTDS